MSDKIWYIYQKSQQYGPYDDTEIGPMFTDNMIAQDAYIFKTGWADWRLLQDCKSELTALLPPPPPPPPGKTQRINRPARTSINGRVIIHNNGQLVIGSGANISISGIFVQTKEPLFKIGEIIKLTCKIEGFKKPFQAEAIIMRFNETEGQPTGYGLKFIKLDQTVVDEITAQLAKNNQQVQAS